MLTFWIEWACYLFGFRMYVPSFEIFRSISDIFHWSSHYYCFYSTVLCPYMVSHIILSYCLYWILWFYLTYKIWSINLIVIVHYLLSLLMYFILTSFIPIYTHKFGLWFKTQLKNYSPNMFKSNLGKMALMNLFHRLILVD